MAKELAEARKAVAEGLADESGVQTIHARFTYRMGDLGKALNHKHEIRNEEVAGQWRMVSKEYRRAMGLALGRKTGKAAVDEQRRSQTAATNTEEAVAGKDNGTVLPDLGMAAMLRHRVRYFTDGAVIGSKAFVNEAFAAARERFGVRRKNGARKLRGAGTPAAGVLWSVRDLRVGV